MPGFVKYRFGPLAGKESPHLLCRERQYGCQPAHHALGDVIHRALRRSPRHTGSRRGVHSVLDHIEIEAPEIYAAEVVDFLVDEMEGVAAVGIENFSLQCAGACKSPAIERQQL